MAPGCVHQGMKQECRLHRCICGDPARRFAGCAGTGRRRRLLGRGRLRIMPLHEDELPGCPAGRLRQNRCSQALQLNTSLFNMQRLCLSACLQWGELHCHAWKTDRNTFLSGFLIWQGCIMSLGFYSTWYFFLYCKVEHSRLPRNTFHPLPAMCCHCTVVPITHAHRQRVLLEVSTST